MFQQAVPVWAAGASWEMNTRICLCAAQDLRGSVLRITTAYFYRVWINGQFAGFGPARAAKGYARVDELPLSAWATGNDTICIEAVGYACRSLSTAYQPSFVCAEVCRGDEVLCATGTDRDFELYRDPWLVQRTERFSMQRHFGEIYDKRMERFGDDHRVTAERVPAPEYLPRRVPMPLYRTLELTEAASTGTFDYHADRRVRKNHYSGSDNPHWGRQNPVYWGVFAEEEIPHKPFRWVKKLDMQPTGHNAALPVRLTAGEYILLDFGQVETGFLRWQAQLEQECDVILAWSESSNRDVLTVMDINCQNVTEHFLPAGAADEMVFEPNTCRTAALFVKSGTLVLNGFGMLTYERDMRGARVPETDDPELAQICRAAINTFAQNAVDLYMDCPSRERGGWLCDSWFTAQAEYFLLGGCEAEDVFLENYRLYQNEGELPQGVLPMCYPGDFNGLFISQWNMWYVLEVRDYILRRNPKADRTLFRPSIDAFLSFLKQYENEDGLLEKLPSWNFVEWSTANDWVMDVNYPTNFLYCEVLRAADDLYHRPELRAQADRLAETLRAKAFDGEVFTDNAVRDENGVLRNTGNVSEAGQYYAVLFGDVNLSDPVYDALNRHIADGFRTFAASAGERPFVPVNAFIGFYLRLKVLEQQRLHDILLRDVKHFFGGMAKETGTLWEYKNGNGSRNHGFASYAAVAIAACGTVSPSASRCSASPQRGEQVS